MKKLLLITSLALMLICLMAFGVSAQEVNSLDGAKNAFDYLGYSFIIDGQDDNGNDIVQLSCSLTRDTDVIFGDNIRFGLAVTADIVSLNGTVLGTSNDDYIALMDLTERSSVANLDVKVINITQSRYESLIYMCLYITDGESVTYLSHTGWGDEPSPISYREVNPLAPKFTSTFENTAKYVYRVGNGNTVKLGSLFKAINDVVYIDSSAVSVEFAKLDNASNVSGAFTANTDDWKNGTIGFSGTGVIAVSIKTEGGEAYTVNLEVVNAKNVTAYSELTSASCVLLNDITMSSGSNHYFSGSTLYGNGFTFDVSNGAYNGTGSITNNYLITLSNAHIDNTKVVGAVYSEYGATVSDNYNRPAVLTYGNSTITNSYISNCASPVRIRDGELTITNTTLKGGNFANLDIRGGKVTLTDVTTINQANGNDKASNGSTVIGLGIVVYYENVTSDTTITINGTLTQYNHISENDTFSNDYASQLVTEMFKSSYSALQYTDSNGVKWVNPGIVSMINTVGDANITDVSGYVSGTPTLVGKTGYVHAPKPTAESTSATPSEYAPSKQCVIAPSYSFDYTSKNYIGKTEGSNDYCYYENGIVYISMDSGDTFGWDTSILTVTKNGIALNYTVTLNGTDYTGKSISFNTAGEYTLVYTYSDPYNYYPNGSEEVTTQSVTYTKEVNIHVSVATPDIKHAEFTFGSGTASTTVTIGNNTYVMPNVSSTSSTIGSTTVDDTTIYYPIVEIVMSDGKTSHTSAWYAYFPVFNNAVTITDYADKGLGSAVTYGSSTTAMPSGLSIVGDPAQLFKYQSSSTAGTSPVVKNNILVYSSPSISAKRSEYNTVIQYIYTDNAGATYYYYIGYHAPAQSYSSCVTPDTMITLADGTQARIDSLTGDEMLLVLNHETGKLEPIPVAYIVNHDGASALHSVTSLSFSDGSVVRIIGEHVFFDYTLNKYIAIDAKNAKSFIGHEFVSLNGSTLDNVKLLSAETTEEYTQAYEVVSYKHLTCFTNGILSTSAYLDKLLNIFDIDDSLSYSYEAVCKDIEEYGLYTYADFEGLISQEAFQLYNAQYLKIAVGKGYITWDDILDLIDIYFNVNVTPIQ